MPFPQTSSVSRLSSSAILTAPSRPSPYLSERDVAAPVEQKKSLFIDLSPYVGSDVNITSSGALGFSGTATAWFQVLGQWFSTTQTFADIKYLAMTLTAHSDQVTVDATPSASRATLSIDAGDGWDSLSIDFRGLRNVAFEQDASGAVRSNFGSYQHFEQFAVTLGGGVNTLNLLNSSTVSAYGGVNSITLGGDAAASSTVSTYGGIHSIGTGSGDDYFYSTASVVHIDAGAGYDQWMGYYQSSKVGLSFALHGGDGALSNGSTLHDIEALVITTGSGNDNFVVTDPAQWASVRGGRGVDTLHLDVSGPADDTVTWQASEIGSYRESGFSGQVWNEGFSAVGFSDIEHLSIIANSVDDVIEVDAAASRIGATLFVDGAGGYDIIAIHGTAAGHSITQNDLGNLVINDTNRTDGDTGQFTIHNVEALRFDDILVDLAALALMHTAQDVMMP